MNIIDTVEIDGLLGRIKPIQFRVDRTYNFLIGQNGTGKTTVINLIAAVLLGDIEKLEKIQYKKILISLKDKSKKTSVRIMVTKEKQQNTPYNKITYAIKNGEKENTITYNVESYRDDHLRSRTIRNRSYHDNFPEIRKIISELLHVRWLSIHRSNDFFERDEEFRNQSSVDRKLNDLLSKIAVYFGRLSRKYSDQILDFQQTSLLSMIKSESGFTLEKFSKEINIEHERQTLRDVFSALQVGPARYESMLDQHVKAFQKASEKLQDHSAGVSLDELAAVYNGWKAHALVRDYGELEKKKLEIFQPKDIFLKTVNDLLAPRKEVIISPRNELTVRTFSGAIDIDLADLSSGEKQLLIILGEALLQESGPVVYIADEPELSLHVKWQEKLTESILAVNKNVQIIFATHSPDIVNVHDDKVIDMEKI